MFAIIQAAGWPIWPLLLASVIAVALIIERSITLRRANILPSTLLEQVLSLYKRQGVSNEVLERLATDSPLGTVLAAGLRNHQSSRYVMKEAIEEAGRGRRAPARALPDHPGHDRGGGAAARALRHRHRHDRDLRLAGTDGRQSAAARPRHLGRAVQHGLRHCDRDSGAHLLPALPQQGGYLRRRDGAAGLKLVDIVHGERVDFAAAERR